jgi:hypothetical protein
MFVLKTAEGLLDGDEFRPSGAIAGVNSSKLLTRVALVDDEIIALRIVLLRAVGVFSVNTRR